MLLKFNSFVVVNIVIVAVHSYVPVSMHRDGRLLGQWDELGNQLALFGRSIVRKTFLEQHAESPLQLHI